MNNASHLRHMDHGYTWYNPNSPDGNPGNPNISTGGCNNTLGGQLCNTHAYTQVVNAQGLCGANDWRMPTVKELENIVDFGRYPAIDADYFPNALGQFFWSSSPYAYNSGNAWGVYFSLGVAQTSMARAASARVRLVRVAQ